MSCEGAGPLVIVEGSDIRKKYKQSLQKHFLPSIASRLRQRLDTILQKDNVPVHRANL